MVVQVVRNDAVSPLRVLRDVLAKLDPSATLDRISTTEHHVGALRGDAVELVYSFTHDGIRIEVMEAWGYRQDNYEFVIDAPADKIKLVEALVHEAVDYAQ